MAPNVSGVSEGERPDFVVTLDGNWRVAIEHTQPRDEQRAAHDHLLLPLARKLRRGLEQHGLHVWVHLTLPLESAQLLTGRAPDPLADTLLAMILHDRQDVCPSWAEYPEHHLHREPELTALQQVHVSESRQAVVTWGTKPLEMRLELLQAAIHSKTEKLSDYRSHTTADEFWLLVVSGPGLGYVPSLLASELRYDNGYQQMHLMDEFGQHCFRLDE